MDRLSTLVDLFVCLIIFMSSLLLRTTSGKPKSVDMNSAPSIFPCLDNFEVLIDFRDLWREREENFTHKVRLYTSEINEEQDLRKLNYFKEFPVPYNYLLKFSCNIFSASVNYYCLVIVSMRNSNGAIVLTSKPHCIPTSKSLVDFASVIVKDSTRDKLPKPLDAHGPSYSVIRRHKAVQNFDKPTIEVTARAGEDSPLVAGTPLICDCSRHISLNMSTDSNGTYIINNSHCTSETNSSDVDVRDQSNTSDPQSLAITVSEADEYFTPHCILVFSSLSPTTVGVQVISASEMDNAIILRDGFSSVHPQLFLPKSGQSSAHQLKSSYGILSKARTPKVQIIIEDEDNVSVTYQTSLQPSSLENFSFADSESLELDYYDYYVPFVPKSDSLSIQEIDAE